MSLSISSLTGVLPGSSVQSTSAAAASTKGSGSSFASTLENAIQSVEQPGQQANNSIQNFLNGDGEELHNVALQVQRASLAFDLGLQVRNKIVSAYQEVMKMQI